jgi:hypothetical protein
MVSKYTIRSREFGRGPAHVQRSTSLAKIQQIVKDQWQGVEYMDGPSGFHTDYCTWVLTGCTLYDLGNHASTDRNSDGYWQWTWKDLGEVL